MIKSAKLNLILCEALRSGAFTYDTYTSGIIGKKRAIIGMCPSMRTFLERYQDTQLSKQASNSNWDDVDLDCENVGIDSKQKDKLFILASQVLHIFSEWRSIPKNTWAEMSIEQKRQARANLKSLDTKIKLDSPLTPKKFYKVLVELSVLILGEQLTKKTLSESGFLFPSISDFE